MGALIDAYRQVVSKADDINQKILNTEALIKEKSKDNSGSRKARITKLQEQLEKIDDYLLRIRGFQELAKKNLDSQNILTIEAPPGYRVNLNRLRNWAMMIDPMSSNDPYAQRVYIVAKCDECFLEKKKKEFTDRIEELNADQTLAINEEIESFKESLLALQEELKQYLQSQEVTDFLKRVLEENKKYWYQASPSEFCNAQTVQEYIAPGAIALPLPFVAEQKTYLKSILGDCYEQETGNIYIPAEIKTASEYVMTVSCVPSRRKYLDRAIQNFMLESFHAMPVGSRKFYILDGLRFNSASLGSFRQLEASLVIEQIPRNPEQMTSCLEYLVSSLSDIDEVIDQYDSVAEYNHSVEKGKRLSLTTLFLFGWPNAFEGRDRELLLRIMRNYERYGISFVTINYKSSERGEDEAGQAIPEYAYQNAIRITMTKNDAQIAFPEGEVQNFAWYTFADQISQDYVQTLLLNEAKKEVIGNEYLKRYSVSDFPQYTREYKKVEIPFGIDGKDQAHSVSFENENFATYLVGASRSGKSTLIHTLIAGLIRNYHPDNVELWLADFKQLEFKRYITYLPPHVKYVLLDESAELVYDLIDRLTAVMLERQKIFAKLAIQRIDQVDPVTLEKPLPVIFVILDEFSIMSQAIAGSDIYMLRLQNILAKGAALGIKFLFSSQTFTTGVRGLTPTARAQIQQRIAMKGAATEIAETLELSPGLKTEQVRNWMDALPPHYALVKFKIGPDTLPVVKRYLVMYFKDYEPRDRMISQINARMKAIEGYNPTDITSYTDKRPVTVDGNTFEAFPEQVFSEYLERSRQTGERLAEEKPIIFGTPRLMEKMKVSALSMETRENILLLSRTAEQACTASILLSSIRSFLMQNIAVQIWAYSKNALFMTYRRVFEQYNVKIVEGMDDVCDAIYALKQSIEKNTAEAQLILLIGMERLCIDFDYIHMSKVSTVKKGPTLEEIRNDFVKKGAVVQTEEEELFRKFTMARYKLIQKTEKELKEQGIDKNEIEKRINDAIDKLEVEMGVKPILDDRAQKQEQNAELSAGLQEQNQEEPKEHPKGAYHALEDFVFVVKQGSRMGCHFAMTLNNLTDLKQCGLKSEFFRYKMAFQLSLEDSRSYMGNASAGKLPEHICQYDDGLTKYSFRPYLHQDIGWEGWTLDEEGAVISPFE